MTKKSNQSCLIPLIVLFFSLVSGAVAQPVLFGLGDTGDGYYQLDTSTIRGAGTKTATAWVIVTQAPESQAKKFGADFMLVMFIMDCHGKTIQPLAWKAKNMKGHIIAEGVHGREKRRKPQAGSMDERIFHKVCTWRSGEAD